MIRPMLAATIEDEAQLEQLRYPVFVQPKLDGRRCLIIKGQAYSRSLKPLPNKTTRLELAALFKIFLRNYDGEIIVGHTLFDTQSAISSHGGEPDWIYYVFDSFSTDTTETYRYRHKTLIFLDHPRIKEVETREAHSISEILGFEEYYLSLGYEGIIIRDPCSPYKYGRSTLKEGYLLKFKRHKTTEGVITEIHRAWENINDEFSNELGLTARSKHTDGLIPKNEMGSITVSHPTLGNVNIGTGFSSLLRQLMWKDQRHYIGMTVTFKYRDYGIKDKPREVVFLAFRDKDDL